MDLPKRFSSFDENKKSGFLELKREKEKGKKVVGVFCSYTPVELIMAANASFVSLCGGSDDSVTAAEAHLPQNLCPVVKSSYGVAITDSCPYFYFSDAIIAETTCDGKKKMYELLGRLKPVHIMHLPQMRDCETSLNLWTEEIHRAKSFLEEQLGEEITEANLKTAIHERNQTRLALLRLYETAKLIPSPISGYELNIAAESIDYNFSGKDLSVILNQKTNSILSGYNKNKSARHRPRLLVTGCPIGGVREKIIKVVEELGADVVAFDTCSGPKAQRELVDETKDPYVALAEKYLNINCSVMTPNSGRFKDLDYLINDYSVDGVIEIILHACHTFAVESFLTQEYVKQTRHLPYLRVDTDYSSADNGQIATRLSAFLEMMER